MKKKTLLTLALSLALVFGAFQAAFAGFGITGTAPDGNELAIETAAIKMMDDTAIGGYALVSTEELKGMLSQNYLIIDTMPAGSFAAHRVVGAINIECGDDGPNGEFTAAQQKALIAAAKKYSGTKDVKYYWNSKSKKWVTKKPAKKYWKACSKKSDKNYGKKTKTVKKAVKDKPIVVYCGFVKCRRSHSAAAYLVSQGYTQVYRYPGGISAWGDAGYEIEGSDAAK